MTIKEMKQQIKDKYAAIPERQISAGNYLLKIGTKYVTILNTWNGTHLIKQSISEFYAEHF